MHAQAWTKTRNEKKLDGNLVLDEKLKYPLKIVENKGQYGIQKNLV